MHSFCSGFTICNTNCPNSISLWRTRATEKRGSTEPLIKYGSASRLCPYKGWPYEMTNSQAPAQDVVTSIGILIIDVQPIVGLGIRALADQDGGMSVLAEVETADQAVFALHEQRIDLAILDSSLGSRDSLEAISRLRSEDPNLPILIFSQDSETIWGARMIQAGAQGYVLHNEPLNQLHSAIRCLASGQRWISSAVRERVLSAVTGQAYETVDSLSNRELEVFTRIGRGESTRVIADALGISSKTVDSHRERIKSKLGVRGARDLVRRAVLFVENEAARV